MLILFLAIFTISIFYYLPLELREEEELDARSFGFLFYYFSFYFYDYFITWILFTSSNVKSFLTNYPTGSFRHSLLNINRKNYISLSRILLSPRALTPNSFKSSFSSTRRLSPSIVLFLKSSMQSPNPIWLSQMLTSSIVQKQTALTHNYYSSSAG